MIYICTGGPTSGDGDDDGNIGAIVGGVIIAMHIVSS